MRGSLVFAPLLVLALAACGGSTSNGDTQSDAGVDTTAPADGSMPLATPLPCDVDSVLDRNCRTCHGATPKFGAPMSLVTWEDLQAPTPDKPDTKVWQEVQRRVHLPDTDPARMPQKPNAPLSAPDLAALDAWFGAGAPARTSGCSTPPDDAAGFEAPSPKPLSCTPDLKLSPKSAWTMPSTTDDIYVCYGFDYTVDAKRHVFGVAPRIENDKIVHHILLMQSDAAVDGTPAACDMGAISKYRMLYGWAPGVGPFELPDVAGLPAEVGTTHYVMQIHYNNVKHLSGETDTSGFDLCTTDKLRPNDADVLALGSLKFTIPPKSSLDITASFTVPSYMPQVHAIGAFPHMHKLGKSIATKLFSGGTGTGVDLGSDPAFDFNNQFFEPLADTLIKPGDRLETRCIWQNPGDTAVTWGEYTENEMCYSFTMYYPKIKSSAWSWQLPAYASKTTTN